MHLIARRLRDEEGGFALATAILGVFLATTVTVATLTAVQGEINNTTANLDHKRAYEAAQAGIADYAFHLNNDNGYWAKCTSVPAPNAVNQIGSTAKRRNVPGGTGPTYAIELLPKTGQASCSTTNPIGTMIESGGSAIGTFRIRSTGYADDVQQRIVASFKRASFLDYVYFTQLETSDPVTYGSASQVSWANANCVKTRAQGRSRPPTDPACDEIVFATADVIDGPLHTNDALAICGSPTFGRNASDVIEVSAPAPGRYAASSSGCTNSPVIKGTFLTSSPVLTPPPTNAQLKNVPGTATYTGQTKIELGGTGSNQYRVNGGAWLALPSSGVIYVSNGSCNAAYSPFTVTYPSSSGCGNVIVSGSYAGQVTIAAENDVIIEGNLCRGSCTSSTDSPAGLLGLIANNFIRVKHPLTDNNTSKGACNDAENTTGTLTNPQIDAALLAINHSFIVDHYNCGDPIGTLTVNGAISQKFRGAVGQVSGGTITHGYAKDYNYDDRLRYLAPPYFLDPVESAWHMQRQTLDP